MVTCSLGCKSELKFADLTEHQATCEGEVQEIREEVEESSGMHVVLEGQVLKYDKDLTCVKLGINREDGFPSGYQVCEIKGEIFILGGVSTDQEKDYS
jgi:hypothetical protein